MEEDDLPRSIVLAVELSCTFASIVAGVIIVIAMGINPYSRSEQQVVMGVVIFAAVLWFAAVLVQAIYRLRIIYIMWKSIQPFGVRISPVAAVGYCLIPLFNIYWLFRVYHDWEQDFNSKVRDSHPHLPPIRTGRAKTAYISTIVSALLSIIPIIGLIAVYIINLGLVVPFLSRADRRARYLLDGLDPLPPLRSGIRRTPRQHQSSTPLIENGIDENTDRNWAMFLHLSLLLAPLVFAVTMMPVILLVGNIATIAIWQVKKGDVPGLDQHGRSVANWIISCVVYLIVLFILRSFNFFFMSEIFYVIQQGLASAIVVCYLVFPIIGGLKAKKGEVWRYPLAIQFFS
jgi:uncharacterized Tic20 family protein